MYRQWNKENMFELREQSKCDQNRTIRKNECLSLVEYENMKRQVLRERKGEEENADGETMAVELWEENEHVAEIIAQDY